MKFSARKPVLPIICDIKIAETLKPSFRQKAPFLSHSLPGKEFTFFFLNRIGLQMGLRDKMGVRSRRESGKHFGYFPWGALSWWGNLLHVQGLGILKIGLEMLKRCHKKLFRTKFGWGELPQLLAA